MKSTTERLVVTLNDVFSGTPWYGDSLMAKLNIINFQFVNEVPAYATNSIAKIVRHIINWKILAIEKLKDNSDFEIALNTEDDWPHIVVHNGEEWEKLLLKLNDSHEAIINLLSKIEDDEYLKKEVFGHAYDFQFLIEGIIQHDIYHAGQIALVYKQVKG